MLKLAVLISGRGTNLQSLIDACQSPGFPAKISVVISSRPDAKGLQRADQADIPAVALNYKNYDSREAFDQAVEDELIKAGVELVCLAGFMRIFSEDFAARWTGRIINIHPSLLPSFKGLNPHRQALEAGVRLSGCTVHYVTPELDAGPIIGQAAVPVHPLDDEEKLAARILRAEHKLYAECVKIIAESRVRYENGAARFADSRAAPSFLFESAPG